MTYATLVKVRDPYHPMKSREVSALSAAGPLSACAPKTDQPFIILRNGEAVLRANWHQPIERGDLIAVVLLPQGGGGSNPLKLVLMIAVSYFTAGLGGAMLGIEGAAAVGSFGVAIANAAVGMLGAALVNALIPTPTANSSSKLSSAASASPTYSLSAQGNTARLEQAIPVQYGRLQCFPDFAAMPYVEYAGNEQYLYQLLCIGAGQYDIEAIRIEDTPISSFDEIETQIIEPGGSITLFPSNVVTSVEVSGQEALTSTWLGPFVANAEDTQAQYIGIDVVMPRGLYYANDDGGLNAVSVTWTVQARLIDDTGAPLGSWATLGTPTVTAATATPGRYSYRYAVTPGRYEVRFQRTDTKQTGSRYGHELSWAGLRAYLPETRDFGNVTLLAMKMKATNNLSSQASRKINVICTRKLLTWHPSTGWSTEAAATRSIAWALADQLKNADYGGGLADARIDLQGLYDLDAVWAARGDTFDGRFDSTLTLWEVLSQTAKAGRAKPYMQGGIVYVVRDQAVTVPVAMYSMRNIVRGSFGMEFLTPSDETADTISVSYYDNVAWKQRRVSAELSGSAASKPAKIELFGVTDRQHAYQEGLYYAACNRYRRTIIRFQTEMEGFIPSFADLIAISHDLPQWGQSFECVAWDAGTRTLTVSEPLTWDSGIHYVGLRKRDGSMSGPYQVTAGADAYHVVLATSPDFTPYTGLTEERTHGCFGWGETWRQLARVTAIRPRGLNTVEIECVNEDPSVHTADQGVTAPPVNSSQLPTYNTAPVVLGLSARSMPGSPEKMLLSWQPAPGADYYLIEQSSDRETWTRTGEPSACNYVATALYGAQTVIRVAAVGMTRGPWVSVDYSLTADYMWTGDANLMWNADDSTLMWRY